MEQSCILTEKIFFDNVYIFKIYFNKFVNSCLMVSIFYLYFLVNELLEMLGDDSLEETFFLDNQMTVFTELFLDENKMKVNEFVVVNSIF